MTPAFKRLVKAPISHGLPRLRQGLFHLVRPVLQEISRLAVHVAADRLQGGEAHVLHLAGFERREIGFSDADGPRQANGAISHYDQLNQPFAGWPSLFTFDASRIFREFFCPNWLRLDPSPQRAPSDNI